MDPRMTPLAGLIRLNTRLFQNCIAGLDNERARQRPTGATNSAAFIAAHLVESRYYILKVLGEERPNPLEHQTGGWKSIDQITDWPTLEDTRSAWADATRALDARMGAVSAAELDAASGTQMPIDDTSVLGLFAFMVQHDSYHIGQLSLLRKHAGLPAMAYT